MALPYCASSDGHQKYSDRREALELRKDSLPLGWITAAINSAKDDVVLSEEPAHEV